MNRENGNPKTFLLCFASGGLLITTQYAQEDILRMFSGSHPEYPVKREARHLVEQFTYNAIPGDYINIQLIKGTPVVLMRVRKQNRD